MEIIKQFDIVLVNLDPTIGSEINKTRPCLVISPNEMNKFLNTIIIAPITSTSKPYPTRVEISGKMTTGWVVIDQVRTIDRRRILKVLGKITDNEVTEVKSVIKETFVD